MPEPPKALDSEISIIEDDEEPLVPSPKEPTTTNKRPIFDPQGFVGAPSDPRVAKRPRLIPPTTEPPAALVPSQAPTTNGLRPQPTAVEPKVPEPLRPPSREIKCLCGVTEPIEPGSASAREI